MDAAAALPAARVQAAVAKLADLRAHDSGLARAVHFAAAVEQGRRDQAAHAAAAHAVAARTAEAFDALRARARRAEADRAERREEAEAEEVRPAPPPGR